MKIGILGGTFNPIHKGHIQATKYAKEAVGLDQVWIIPSYKNVTKKTLFSKDDPKLRYKITKKTVEDLNLSWLKIKDFEHKIKGTSYSHKTVKYIKDKYPDNKYYWIIGDDLYDSLDSWKNIDYIRDNLKFIVLRRTKVIKDHIENNKNVIYLKDKYLDISSTDTLVNANWDNIEEATKIYFPKKYLYIKDIVFLKLNGYGKTKFQKENLYVHSLSVAKHAKRLAKTWNYSNPEKAYYAGLVHDLFKSGKPDQQWKEISGRTKWVKPPDKAMHGFYAAYWFKYKYEIEDEEFTNALKRHTLADYEMTKLDKIVFIADKIADDRKTEVAKKYRKFAYKDLDKAFEDLLKILINKLQAKDIEPDRRTLEAYENIKKVNNPFYKNEEEKEAAKIKKEKKKAKKEAKKAKKKE